MVGITKNLQELVDDILATKYLWGKENHSVQTSNRCSDTGVGACTQELNWMFATAVNKNCF